MIRHRGRAALAATALAWLATPCSAALVGFEPPRIPTLERGAHELRPYAAFSQIYDSNIYFEPHGGTASWIRQLWTGARGAARVGGPHRLEGVYDLSYRSYDKDAARNDALTHRATAAYFYTRETGVAAGAADDYLDTVDPATSEIVERVRRRNNTVRAFALRAPEGARLSIGADAWHSTDLYARGSALAASFNRYTQSAGIKAGWRLFPLLRAFASYHRQVVRYTAAPEGPKKNAKAHQVDAGLERRATSTLAAQAQIGLEERRYDDETPGEDRTFRRWTSAARLTYTPLERTQAELLVSRSLQESSYTTSRFYVASAGRLTVVHRLPFRTVARLYGSRERDTFVGAERTDDVYEAGAALEHPVRRWLTVGAAYTYRARFSSVDLGYRESLAALTLSVAL